ncbi:MAG: 50S ribosomal protein L32 [Candidatus Buchananbacteria bacterium]|nr:50S ribosomal protein L32 [Candidatus Buchananbacteria bacterium]
MPVPPKRRSASKGRRGRAHQGLKTSELVKCAKCGKSIKSHRACPYCGSYQGREVVKIKSKVKKPKK